MASRKRDHLVDVACDLFYRNGFHATGIDSILAEAGVAKMTLYNHFKSKEALILASLERQELQLREWFVAEVEKHAGEPADMLLAMFDVLEKLFRKDGFSGCMFIKATSEYPDLNDPIHQIAIEHQRNVHAYVRGLAEAAGAADPDALAEQLCLLMRGAIATVQVIGGTEAARQAGEMAEAMINHAIETKPRRKKLGKNA